MTALSDRLNEAKGDKGLDTVVAQAEARGHTVHRGTFANYFRGKHAKRPSEDVLLALADGLDLKVTELRAIVGMPAGELGEYKPTPLANRLNRDQRIALDELIRTIVSKKEVQTDGNSSAEKRAEQLEADAIDSQDVSLETESLKRQDDPEDTP